MLTHLVFRQMGCNLTPRAIPASFCVNYDFYLIFQQSAVIAVNHRPNTKNDVVVSLAGFVVAVWLADMIKEGINKQHDWTAMEVRKHQ